MPTKETSLLPLPDTAFQSEKPALTKVIKSLAGRARHLYELAAGVNPVDDEPPASSFNPQGKLGHDHSGPPWGSCFLHPITYAAGVANSTSITAPAPIVSALDEATKTLAWAFWHRPFASFPQVSARVPPYSRLYPRFVAFLSSGASSTLILRVRARNPMNRTDIADTSWHEESFSVTSTSEQTKIATAGGDCFLPAVPGYNFVEMEFEATGDPVNVSSFSLCNIVKRTH